MAAAQSACDAPMSEMDVLPTLVKLAGGKVPSIYGPSADENPFAART